MDNVDLIIKKRKNTIARVLFFSLFSVVFMAIAILLNNPFNPTTSLGSSFGFDESNYFNISESYNNFVSYSGANSDVNLGNHSIFANNVCYSNGTNCPSVSSNLTIASFPSIKHITECQELNESGFYELDNDIEYLDYDSYDRLNPCLNITADHVILNGKGHKILGAGTSDAERQSGIIIENVSGVIVNNFNFENIDSGIELVNTNNNYLFNINSTITGTGIALIGDVHAIKLNTIESHDYDNYGIDINSGSNDITSNGNPYDIEVKNYNTTNNGDGISIQLHEVTDSTLKNLNLDENNNRGILLRHSNNNLIDKVRLNDSRDGILFESSSNNKIHDVDLINQAENSIKLYGSNNEYSNNNEFSDINIDTENKGMLILNGENNTFDNINSNAQLQIYKGSGNQIVKSGFDGSSDRANIYLHKTQNALVDNIKSHDIDTNGIKLSDTSNSVINHINIVNVTNGNGIDVSQASHDNSFTNIRLSDLGADGINVRGDTYNNSIMGLQVYSVTGQAVYSETSSNDYFGLPFDRYGGTSNVRVVYGGNTPAGEDLSLENMTGIRLIENVTDFYGCKPKVFSDADLVDIGGGEYGYNLSTDYSCFLWNGTTEGVKAFLPPTTDYPYKEIKISSSGARDLKIYGTAGQKVFTKRNSIQDCTKIDAGSDDILWNLGNEIGYYKETGDGLPYIWGYSC